MPRKSGGQYYRDVAAALGRAFAENLGAPVSELGAIGRDEFYYVMPRAGELWKALAKTP